MIIVDRIPVLERGGVNPALHLLSVTYHIRISSERHITKRRKTKLEDMLSPP